MLLYIINSKSFYICEEHFVIFIKLGYFLDVNNIYMDYQSSNMF